MITDKAYHLTSDGRAVSDTDPAGIELLVCRHGEIDDEKAIKYGLPIDFEAKAVKPVDNKAVKPVDNKAA